MTQVTGGSPPLSAEQAAKQTARQAARQAAGRTAEQTGRQTGRQTEGPAGVRAAERSERRSRSAVLVFTFLRGGIAAGLGLGALTVLVMVLWISSPSPYDGPSDALHTAAGLWLLAHGAELIRTDTLDGIPAPVGLVPLLPAVLPLWLVHRAARDASEAEEGGAAPSASAVFGLVTGGYAVVMAAVALYARGGSPSVRAVSLLFPAALVVAAAAAAGVWTAYGHPVGPLPARVPMRVRATLARSLFRERAATVWRSAAAGVMTLLGGGALLVAVALVWHADAAQQAFDQLVGGWADRGAVLLLALVLVPNAAVWAAAYGLGPGFALGTASTVTPLAFSGSPALPVFPLLAAVPEQGEGTWPNWAAAVVPVAAGVVVARFTVRSAVPVHGTDGGGDAGRGGSGADADTGGPEEAWSAGGTALTAALGALGCGSLMAVLAAAAGGPLGTRALAEFGPVWWLTGAAAAAWTMVLAVPGALLLRAWRLRGRNGGRRRGRRRSTAGGAEETAGTGRTARSTDRTAGTEGAVGTARVEGAARSTDRTAGAERVAGAEGAAGRPVGQGPAEAPVPPARPRKARTRRGSARASTPRGVVTVGGAEGTEDDDAEPYDFLPTDPWHARTARRAGEDAGPSGKP
ncbi:DUF6350 family protein [Streptomyces sp. NPDC002476]|uniref:cell division protein PerM n=1 Tax=Streptomyces sp. NPDC002476 TaxID=3364648 RepID=UPI00368605F6